MNIPEVGTPNTAAASGNIMWENPRVEAASTELFNAARHHAEKHAQNPFEVDFAEYASACNRLHHAAMAYAATIKEYTL